MIELAFAALASAFFLAGTYFWLDARNQRRRALTELRIARRLRLHADRTCNRYLEMSKVSLELHAQLENAWRKMYDTPFPVPKPRDETRPFN